MGVATLLNAVSANTTGPVAGLGTPYGNLTLSVSTTGTVSAFSVVLQGSNDGFSFGAIGSAITSPTAGTAMGSGVLFQYFQAVLSGYSGTGTVTVELAYSLESASSGGGGPGAVTSVFTRTGAVVAASGDYTVSQVTGAAPLASPALTGAPTAPTASALTDSTQLATTAYADSAVGVETSRAQTAEALKLAKASNLSDVASASTALANLGGVPLAAESPWTAADSGYLAMSCPIETVTSGTTITSGTIYVTRVNVRQQISCTNVVLALATNSGTLTSGETYAALYAGQTSGGYTAQNQIAATGNQSVNWGSSGAAGQQVMALTSGPYTLPAGFYWVVFLAVGTGTMPTFSRTGGSTSALFNAGCTSTTYRTATAGTTQTVLPGTLGTMTGQSSLFWAGLS